MSINGSYISIGGIPTVSVILYETEVTGEDSFGHEIKTETPVTIDNVSIGHPSSEDVLSEISISGKRIAYNLCLPVGDDHDWTNTIVEFYGRKWRTIGIPTQFTDGFMGKNFPWNKQIKVEAYE